MSLTHKFKEEYAKIEMTAPISGRRFNEKTLTQGDIDRMDERQKSKYLEPIKGESKPPAK